MAWQDRPYYRDRTPSRMGPLMWLLSGSVPLFTFSGIRVRMHASLLVLIVLELLLANTRFGMGGQNALTFTPILFASVLLHEFGHCFGARWVGGEADEILMWPLGGLAMSRPPRRPWPSFITTAAGPGVTLAICVIAWCLLLLFGLGDGAMPWFPFHSAGLRPYIPQTPVSYYIWWIFTVNYGLFMFNMLLVFYPFDGGRMIQELLWVKLGYYRSMQIATAIGMVGAVALAAFGLVVLSLLFLLIAGFGFHTCWRQRQLLREIGPDGFEDEGGGLYAAAYEPATPKRKRRTSRAARRAIAQARRSAAEAKLESERLDAILAKVSAAGMASLTWRERRVLRRATESRRKRDIELSR